MWCYVVLEDNLLHLRINRCFVFIVGLIYRFDRGIQSPDHITISLKCKGVAFCSAEIRILSYVSDYQDGIYAFLL